VKKIQFLTAQNKFGYDQKTKLDRISYRSAPQIDLALAAQNAHLPVKDITCLKTLVITAEALIQQGPSSLLYPFDKAPVKFQDALAPKNRKVKRRLNWYVTSKRGDSLV